MKRNSIYLLRHGETDWNRIGRIQGIKDIPLNKNGLRQAKKMGKYLRKLRIDLIYTSPLKRAKETAEIINEFLNTKIVVSKSLMEMPVNYNGLENTYLLQNENEFRVFEHSVIATLNEIKELNKNILIVGHGTWIKVIMCEYNGKDFFDESSNIENCELNEYEV
ncbi:MAG: histidine phosphatase family protein [Bacilli bacterium]